MSTSRINFNQLRQENLKGTFAALERAFVNLDIRFYLIGALARDTWFADKGIRSLGTKDVDFAVLVGGQENFDALKNFLVKTEKFTETSNEYTLRDLNGFEVDLFPFGVLNIEGKKIVDKEGLVRTDITGFREVYDEATIEVTFENQYTFRVASLAGIVILKLIAWDDRPEMRSDDIRDIAAIMNNYFELEEQIIYGQHIDLFEEEFSNLRMLAGRVLGREMAAIVAKNELLKDRILSILDSNKTAMRHQLFILMFDNESPAFMEDQADLVTEIIKGIKEKLG